MSHWLLTLQNPHGLLGTVESGETEFVLGTETAADVFTVAGDGVAPRHAWVRIEEGALQVEDLAGGTLVNGYSITERVQVAVPASVQVGEIVLHVDALAARKTETASPALAETIPATSNPRSGSRANERTSAQGNRSKPGIAETATSQDLSNRASTLCDYQLVKEIARGGMGEIHLGEDPQLGRQVAVKVSILACGGEDPRFEKEAHVLAQLAHPNIVPIHAKGIDAQGRPFYSMKLIKGRTLQAVLNAIRNREAQALRDYPLAALLTIFRKVCDALAYAHSKSILHRDLKPENIMVGEYGEVLVMDWGLAKVLGAREDSTRATATRDTGDYGMTLEGEVMGTPQYMSPEQAEGMVADLDTRSDIYSLGGILYALLTLHPPIEGKTLHEVLTKVKSGGIRPMTPNRRNDSRTRKGSSAAMKWEVPEALQAVTFKAMALDRDKRYPSVEAFAADIEAYQNGFATSAEAAGLWKQAKLWVKRNTILTGAAAVLAVVVTGFTARVIQKGREAGEALRSLRDTAPTFAIRARDALQDGQFDEALKAATFATKLEPGNWEYHSLRGHALEVLVRWGEAVEAYQQALRLGGNSSTQENLALMETLIAQAKSEGDDKARIALFKALNEQKRQAEAMEFGKGLGDFWHNRQKDLSAVSELMKHLESKLIAIPGTGVSMCSTELTVGEWKLYLRAEGLPDWRQPSSQFEQTDEHPVVGISWDRAKELGDWLSQKTGKEWRLPTHAEWEAAIGHAKYPWGTHYPPQWDDGNYGAMANGQEDRKRIGSDQIMGTAPVASFKPSELGFYDLAGNVWEWMLDGVDEKTGNHLLRGGGWLTYGEFLNADYRIHYPAGRRLLDYGFRLVRQ